MKIDSQLVVKFERQVLAKLITTPESYFENYEVIHDDLFKNAKTSAIFKALRKTLDTKKNPDAFDIADNMIPGMSVMGLEDIISMQEDISHDTDFANQLGYLISYDKYMKFEKNFGEARIKIKGGDDIVEVISNLEEVMLDIKTMKKSSITSIGECIDDYWEELVNKKDEDEEGFFTGLTMYDRFSGGFQPGDFVVIGADSSQGKTSLCLTLTRNSTIDFKNPVAIYSMEMGKKKISNRLISMETGISNRKIRSGNLDDDEKKLIKDKTKKLKKAPIYIDDQVNNSFHQIANSIRRLVIQKKIKFAIIDYLQLVTLNDKNLNREQEVGKMARGFKNLATELDIAIIALSQLGRVQNKRQNGIPKVSDLRDSGQIEEAADVILLIYRPEVYGIKEFEDGSSTSGIAELIIGKGRDIGTTKFRLLFDKVLTKFTNEEQEKKETETADDIPF